MSTNPPPFRDPCSVTPREQCIPGCLFNTAAIAEIAAAAVVVVVTAAEIARNSHAHTNKDGWTRGVTRRREG